MAKFRCLTCVHEWEDKPGPHVKCPKCGAAYVKWLDYDSKARLVDILTRAKTWLTTAALIQRSGMGAKHVPVKLHELASDGVVEHRAAPENLRQNEWRVREGLTGG